MPLERMPHQDVSNYFEARQVNRLPPRFPRWDEGRTQPALRALITRRDVYEAQRKLEDVRRAGAKARRILQVQIDNVVGCELDLGRNFIKFNGFVRENKDKRERAERKIEESRLQNDELQCEIDILQDKYQGYMAIKDSIGAMIEKYSMYERFLDASAELSPYLNSVQSVVKRYEALMSARFVISQRLQENMVSLNKTMERIKRIQAEKSAQIVQMKYELRQKEKRHGAVRRFKDDWEQAIVKISNMSYGREADIDRVRFSSWDLYKQMADRRHLPITLDEFDQEGHYTFIKESINLLRRCVEESERLIAEGCADVGDEISYSRKKEDDGLSAISSMSK